MIQDTKLSGVLHVLLHMAAHQEPVTSDVLARAMNTNPVVIRRIMAGLKARGYVRSEKGHGGGWTLGRELSAITLKDVYMALGAPTLLAIGNRTEDPTCLVERAVNTALGDTFAAAEALIVARLGEVTLAQLSADFRSGLAGRDSSHSLERAHAH